MHEMIYKNYVRVITKFNMLRKNQGYLASFYYVMMESMGTSCITVWSRALRYFPCYVKLLWMSTFDIYVRHDIMWAFSSVVSGDALARLA